MNIFDFFKREFEYSSECGYRRIIDCAVVNLREAYLAVEQGYPSGGKEVFAVVCLLSYRPNDYYNIGYKDMSEDMHPYYYNCPERILKLLTPTDNEQSNEWRRKCWERIQARKNRPRLKKGMVIKFAEPIRFRNGWTEQQFRVEDPRRLLFSSGGIHYKLTRWILDRVPFQVVQA